MLQDVTGETIPSETIWKEASKFDILNAIQLIPSFFNSRDDTQTLLKSTGIDYSTHRARKRGYTLGYKKLLGPVEAIAIRLEAITTTVSIKKLLGAPGIATRSILTTSNKLLQIITGSGWHGRKDDGDLHPNNYQAVWFLS